MSWTAEADLVRSQVGRSVAISEDWRGARQGLLAAADDWVASNGADREDLAQRICGRLIEELWRHRVGDSVPWAPHWRCLPSPALAARLRTPLDDAADALAPAAVVELGFLVGSLYTALLPPDVRADRGAYYTPPLLAQRLLDLLTSEGCDWRTARVLDPACGGGAFLVPVADRIANDYRTGCLSPAERLSVVERAVVGIEIDPFAAWMTEALLQLLLVVDARLAGRPLRVRIEVADALRLLDELPSSFDAVVGNPPYGRVRLTERQRRTFGRSLHGHANLYSLFLDAALRWRAPTGLVGFVTPTSFLGGTYFKGLRALLLDEAPPLVLDILEQRTGVFQEVQQETCLAVFGRTAKIAPAVHHLRSSEDSLSVERAGSFALAATGGAPWVLPRSNAQARLVGRLDRFPNRLHTLGYRASTGPLVWNRHKPDLRERVEPTSYPLIWAEAVRPNAFEFQYRQRARSPFVRVAAEKGHLLDREPCVLVQRTTAKEQHRRLIACAVPQEFFTEWGAVVVENHVNVLRRRAGSSAVTPRALAAVLNARAIDELFRCLSGSVAVSAAELHALPLPELEVFQRVEEVLERDPLPDLEAIDRLVAELAGVAG